MKRMVFTFLIAVVLFIMSTVITREAWSYLITYGGMLGMIAAPVLVVFYIYCMWMLGEQFYKFLLKPKKETK